MALANEKQKSIQEEKTREEKDVGVWGDKQHLTRLEFREKLRDPDSKLNLFAATGVSEQERIEIEKDFVYGKYGPLITKSEMRNLKQDLEKKARELSYGGPQKVKIERKIKVLKEFLKK